MILSELKNYVKSRRQVSLRDLVLHFDAEPEAIRGMLEFWISKGRISKQVSEVSCGGCACSISEEREIYIWNPQLGKIPIETKPNG